MQQHNANTRDMARPSQDNGGEEGEQQESSSRNNWQVMMGSLASLWRNDVPEPAGLGFSWDPGWPARCWRVLTCDYANGIVLYAWTNVPVHSTCLLT
ncbi:hypothetical protein IAQ61_006719 [Plenodomus lingam]|uniref:uncharacterized protein n=1 Tax=Leptosphaeria maculans TaxID=5022 RepID=UPI0033242502|nr:hypothetical protein IAQ61_006719 [Plenodomus lingam]